MSPCDWIIRGGRREGMECGQPCVRGGNRCVAHDEDAYRDYRKWQHKLLNLHKSMHSMREEEPYRDEYTDAYEAVQEMELRGDMREDMDD